MNKEEFGRCIKTKIRDTSAFGTVVEQEFSVVSRTVVNRYVAERSPNNELRTHMQREGRSAIAAIVYGDIRNKLRKFRSVYMFSDLYLNVDAIRELDEIIDYIPE